MYCVGVRGRNIRSRGGGIPYGRVKWLRLRRCTSDVVNGVVEYQPLEKEEIGAEWKYRPKNSLAVRM